MLSLYAAEKNKAVIGEVLSEVVEKVRSEEVGQRPLNVFEVASGTGEHAHLFNSTVPGLLYQPTEYDASMMDSILAWTKVCILPYLLSS